MVEAKAIDICISEMNRTDSTEGTIKLSEFFFYSMDVFQHQLNDINRFIGVPANKELSCYKSLSFNISIE